MQKIKNSKVVAKVINEDKALLITTDEDTPDYYGISIVKANKATKQKLINYEHVLTKKETFLKMLKDMYYAKAAFEEKILYIPCKCYSEILRAWYMPRDEYSPEMFFFDIFDNYFLKCPKGIQDNIYLSCGKLKDLCEQLDLSLI